MTFKKRSTRWLGTINYMSLVGESMAGLLLFAVKCNKSARDLASVAREGSEHKEGQSCETWKESRPWPREAAAPPDGAPTPDQPIYIIDYLPLAKQPDNPIKI